MKDLADVVTADLLQLRRKVLGLLAEQPAPLADAQDAYVSALIGHLFAVLMTGFGSTVDKSPERLADALNLIARKSSLIAGSLDPASEYRIQIFRREHGA
jgi:hypothetical protein